MSDGGLRYFLGQLEASGSLVHFRKEVGVEYEIPAVIKYIAKNVEKAVVFDKVKGYESLVVGNLFGSRKHLAIAFGIREEELEKSYVARAQNPIKPTVVGSGPVQEVVVEGGIDLQKVMPLLTHHAKDAGAYMSSAITVAKDPETGMRGMGLHRIQIKGKDGMGFFLGTPPLSEFLAKAERMGKPLEIAVVSGVDPWTFCASVFYAPEGIDKFDIAGGFAGRSLELVKCRSVDLEVPADAEFVLEGHIIPGVREKEGPFGESTGYYLTYDNPVGKIEVITHRAKPIYHALMPFTQDEEILIDVMMRPWMLGMLQESFPGKVRGLSLGAVCEFCAVQIEKKGDDDALKVIEHLLATPFIKIAVVVDSDVDICEPKEVIWAMCTRARPDKDVIIKSALLGSMIDPSVEAPEVLELGLMAGRTSKIGIDATKPLEELERFERINVPPEVEKKILDLIEVIK